MNKKGELGIGGIVVLFIGIVFAIALFTPILDTIGLMNNKQTVDNLSVSTVTSFGGDNLVLETVEYVLYTQSDWKRIDCPLSSVVIRNGAGTDLVADTDYTLNATGGSYTLLNTTLTVPEVALNSTQNDFTYCADGYNKDAGSRGMNNLILIMTSLILLGFVLEKSGVIDLGSMIGR